MLENPQHIIKIQKYNAPSLPEDPAQLPDVIYIPFLNRYDNLNDLLLSLSWFENQIVILTSNENGKAKINTTKNNHVSFINCSKYKQTNKIRKLKTFQSSNLHQEIGEWDLPLKRNFALLHAKQNKLDRILLIDDDIEGVSKTKLNLGVAALSSNNISGCLIVDFPDTSVIGHIEQTYGEPYFPFLSGNFMFIDSRKTKSFFPRIYNEDWLFMIPSILENKVSVVGEVSQKRYDPFDDICRIRLQEFGEVMAEGLFELINQTKFEDRYKEHFWSDYLNYRKSYVKELLPQASKTFAYFITESLAYSEKIKARNCIEFIENWEDDILTFNSIIENEA